MDSKKSMKKILLILVSLFTLVITPARADLMHFERGGASTVTGLVEKGQLNYEGGIFNYADEFNGKSSAEFVLGASKIRYGLSDRLELRLLNSGVFVNDSLAGMANLGLGFKLAITEGNRIMPTINLVTDFQIPFGRSELRNPGFNHSYLAAISQTLIGKLGALVNFGISFDSGPNDSTFVNLPFLFDLNYAINDKIGIFTDIYGNWGPSGMPLAMDFGFAYAFTDNFVVDLSLNWGLNESAPDFGVDMGFAVRLK
jgi:hypothetical protein